MALDKDTLGTDLYNALDYWNNKDRDDIGDIEDARLAFCKKIAEVVIDHFKGNAEVTLNPTGLTAGGYAVVGTAQSELT